MIPANKLYYLSSAKPSVKVFMLKEGSMSSYTFNDQQYLNGPRLKICLFSVAGGVVVCYELSREGRIIAEDTSEVLHKSIVPGLVATIFFDVFS